MPEHTRVLRRAARGGMAVAAIGALLVGSITAVMSTLATGSAALGVALGIMLGLATAATSLLAAATAATVVAAAERVADSDGVDGDAGPPPVPDRLEDPTLGPGVVPPEHRAP